MAKNITILEGSTSKSFSNVNKLRVNNVGGGTSDWVPEDETQLTTKHISENGTYTASDDGYYGYSEVTVNGIGSASYTASEGDTIGGVELTGGNEYSISTDPETGDVVVEELASSIVVGHQPDKTSYVDGEEIDIDGLVIIGHTADGAVWDNENYPNGIIPLREISITPTVADIEAYDEPGTIHIDDVGDTCVTNSVTFYVPRDSASQRYKEVIATSAVAFYYNGRTVYMISNSPFSFTYSTLGGTGVLYNGYYWTWVRFGYAIGSSTPAALSVNLSGPEIIDRITSWNPTSGGQRITVNWTRPQDGETLDTSFNIRVTETTSGGNETTESEATESGSGAGHSF